MPIVETILTVAAVVGLVNRLIRVFRSIKKWLKNNDHLYKENKRMMKILKDYSERNKNSNCQLPRHISVMAETLQERENDWSEAPGIEEAEDEAEEQDDDDEDGYITEYDPSDLSGEDADEISNDYNDDEEEDCVPDDNSDEDDDGSDEGDDGSDEGDDSDSPIYGSDEEDSDEQYDSD